MKLIARHAHASHVTLGSALYSRTDTGEWFLSYAMDAWQPLTEAAALELAFSALVEDCAHNSSPVTGLSPQPIP